jgi:hypothetical protein
VEREMGKEGGDLWSRRWETLYAACATEPFFIAQKIQIIFCSSKCLLNVFKLE